MNNLSTIPYIFMHMLQLQNVKRNVVKKIDISHLNKKEKEKEKEKEKDRDNDD